MKSQDRRWVNRQVNRQTDARQARGLWLRCLLLIVALAPGGLWLWKQSRCVQMTYEVQRMRDERDLLLESERRLRAERAEAASLDRIERWAARQRALTRPESAEIVVLRPETALSREEFVARSRE